MSYSQLGLFASVDVTPAQSRATPPTRTKVEKIGFALVTPEHLFAILAREPSAAIVH